MFLLYLLFALTVAILLFFAYVRIKFKFWAIQPVMHVYDVKYWFSNKGIIQIELPKKNKYCNFKSIETISFDKTSNIKIDQFIHLIQNDYLSNNDNVFHPLKNNIVPYFVGHNTKSFWSFYWEDNLMQSIKHNTVVNDAQLIAVITSRPLQVVIYDGINREKRANGEKHAKLQVYYVDYLCVKHTHRKKGIAQEMIQTHEYNQSHLNLSMQVSLFKREDELTGIIPLCVYNTYAFSMKNWCKPAVMFGEIALIRCGKENIHFLSPLLQRDDMFDITIMPEMGNILELIKTNNIFVYMLVNAVNHETVGAYFFRKSCTFIKKGAEALVCFASIFENGATNDNSLRNQFIHGYKVALSQICESNNANNTAANNANKDCSTSFQFAVVEDISANNIIIQNLMEKTSPLVVSPTAYFFYNFACPTFKSNKTLIIN